MRKRSAEWHSPLTGRRSLAGRVADTEIGGVRKNKGGSDDIDPTPLHPWGHNGEPPGATPGSRIAVQSVDRDHRCDHYRRRQPEGVDLDRCTAVWFLTRINGDRLAPLLELAASTGMRRGELLGLRWEQTDLETGRI